MTLGPQPYRKVDSIHRVGLAAARPAADDVLIGTLYYSTDVSKLERSNGTIWETYSVASTGGSTPGLHATTHIIGGTDTIPNVAWINQSNVFTQNQIIERVSPTFNLIDSSRPVDKKLWRIVNSSELLYFLPTNDAVNANESVTFLNRAGQLTLPGGADISGTIATSNMTMRLNGSFPGIIYNNPTLGTDLKLWRTFVDGSARYHVDTLNDAMSSVLSTPLLIDRNGNTTISGNLLKIVGPAQPAIGFYDSNEAAGTKYSKFQADAGSLILYMLDDNDTVVQTMPITAYRNGNVKIGGTLETTGPVVIGAPATQYSPGPNNASLYLYDPTMVSGSRTWRIMNQSTNLIFYSQADGESAYVNAANLTRVGAFTSNSSIRSLAGNFLHADGALGMQLASAHIQMSADAYYWNSKNNAITGMTLDPTIDRFGCGHIVCKTIDTQANQISSGPIISSSTISASGSITSNYSEGLYIKGSSGYARAHFRDLSQPANNQTHVILEYSNRLIITPTTDDTGTNPIGGDWFRSLSIDRVGVVRTGTGGFFCQALYQGGGNQLDYGTYTPTVTLRTNVSGCSAYIAAWHRVGNVVTVAGQIDVTTPNLGTQAFVSLSLPLASNITTGHYIGGVVAGTAGDVGYINAGIYGADLVWTTRNVGTLGMKYTYTYAIV